MRKALLLLVLGSSTVVYAQWPQWRGPGRDGSSPETNLLECWPAEGPKLLWSCATIGEGYSSAVMEDTTIYITGRKGDARLMTALDLKGRTVWQKNIGKTKSEEDLGECSTPTLHKGKLYTVTVPGDICCVDAHTGTVDWAISLPDQLGEASHFCESPLVVDDKVIVTPCGEKATLMALNRATGATVWKSASLGDTTAYVSPVLVPGKSKTVIVTNTREHILAVDPDTGAIVWQKEIPAETFIPLPHGRQVYFPSCMMLNISDDLSRFDASWQDTVRRKDFGGTVKLGSRIFGTNEQEAGVFCLDWETGKQLACNEGIKGATLLAADGMIYSYEESNGRVSLLKPTANGIEIQSSFAVKLGKGAHLAHMSIGHGLLFIRHGDTLMAYDVRQS